MGVRVGVGARRRVRGAGGRLSGSGGARRVPESRRSLRCRRAAPTGRRTHEGPGRLPNQRACRAQLGLLRLQHSLRHARPLGPLSRLPAPLARGSPWRAA
eukprot:scaffold27059_cov43-Phaeocystis_antarctica.AAC.1